MIDAGVPAAASSRTVFLTGASGFIGRHVCDQLLARGWKVRALVRSTASFPPKPGVEVVRGELIDRDALRDAANGASVLIHLAGRVPVPRETEADARAAFRRVNADATRVILEEVLKLEVRRVIYLSSVASICAENSAVVTDATVPAPSDAYGTSKRDGELVVEELCSRSGIGYTILRPPMVYGPGMKGNPLKLFDLVVRGVPLPLGSVRNRRSILYVGNLAAAIEAVLRLPADSKEAFVVGDGEAISTPALVRMIARALHRPARIFSAPIPLIHAAAWVGDYLARIGPFPLTSSNVSHLTASLEVDFSRLATTAGYRPRYSPEEGMRHTGEWYFRTSQARRI